MNKEMEQKFLDMGLSPTTAKNYACGEWAIPSTIQKLLEEKNYVA